MKNSIENIINNIVITEWQQTGTRFMGVSLVNYIDV